MLLVGWQEGHPACKKTGWSGAGVVICLECNADLHMAQLIPLPLTVSCFSKSRLVIPFWYRLTRVVPEKGPLNRCETMQINYQTSIKTRQLLDVQTWIKAAVLSRY